MNRLHKSLIAILCATIVVLVTVNVGEVSIFKWGNDSNSQGASRSASADLHDEDGIQQKHKVRERTATRTPREVRELLQQTIISDLSLEGTTLAEATATLNQQIRELSSNASQPPKLLIHDVSNPSNTPNIYTLEVRPMHKIELKDSTVFNALSSVCNAYNTQFFIYRGNVYITQDMSPFFSYIFYADEHLRKVQFDDLSIASFGSELSSLIEDHEYFGQKPKFNVVMSKQTQQALLAGKISIPTITTDLKNVTINEALQTICDQSNGNLKQSNTFGEIIFDPLNERTTGSIDEILSNPTIISRQINIPLDENWNQATKEPSSPSK